MLASEIRTWADEQGEWGGRRRWSCKGLGGSHLVCLSNQAEEFGLEGVGAKEAQKGLDGEVTILLPLNVQTTHKHWRKGQFALVGRASGRL